MKRRAVAGAVALQMIWMLCCSVIMPAAAESDVIMIGNKEEFIAVAQQCTLDTWSQGKTVQLTANIDFAGNRFVPIPTFGGTFDGNGYVISGVSVEEKGSYQGVFRYVQQTGKVSDLQIRGKITPGGAKSYVGGIAGENAGTIENCSFDGTVKGENITGGIAGNNTDSGKILSCAATGSVSGENATGGIAGKNTGFLQGCTNQAAVNTGYEEKKKEISDLDMDTGAMLENYKNKEEENEEDSLLGHSDTGGIVGYTTGIVQGCTNRAAIGYQHIGYNVGGVAGRQAGYMLGCQNYGLVQGRKDVGGIVGQAEPYILLNASESMLKDLRRELDTLHTMVNRFITDADTMGDDARKHLDGISAQAEKAGDNAEALLQQGTDFVDDNLDEINAQVAVLSNTLDRLTPVFETLENGSADLKSALDQLSVAFDDIDLQLPELEDELDEIETALEDIKRAEECLQTAISRISKTKNSLEDAIRYQNPNVVSAAMGMLSSAIQEMVDARRTIQTALESIQKILETQPKEFETLGVNVKEIAANVKLIAQNNITVITSLVKVKNSLDTILSNTEISYKDLKSAANHIQIAIGYFSSAMRYAARGMENLIPALRSVFDQLGDYVDHADEELNRAKENVSAGLKTLSYAAEDMTEALGEMKEILTDLAEEDALEFVKLGDAFQNDSENLFDALAGISDEINGLKQALSDGADKITGDVTSISNQFQVVMHLLIDEVEELQTGSRDLEDVFVDASDENIDHTRQGKVADCHNFGNVEADRNTGGIVGAMAIEYSKDPEDELEKPNTLNFTYRSKAILQSCINDGKTIGKKDCTGGIAGLAELGTIYECENYAQIESTNGNYVGGVAGKSESTIRKSYAKATVKGKRYVGGIAGKADTLSAGYAIARVEGEENTGAICGDAEAKEKLYANFFVDNGLGAMDGISYQDQAEPIRFEQLREKSGIPARFISFSVTFLAEDTVVETQEIKYGDSTDRIRYPKIPEKEGHFGKWETIETTTVTENLEVHCVYQPYITMLSSEEKNENGKMALALCEGEFTDEARLHVHSSATMPPVKKNEKVQVYEVLLSNSDIQSDETVSLRLLNEKKENVKVWQYREGNWEKLDVSKKGKYVCVQTKGTKATVCLQYEEKSAMVLPILSMVAVLGVLIGGVLLRKKRKKNKTGARTAQTSA